jgi:hypothetical protein
MSASGYNLIQTPSTSNTFQNVNQSVQLSHCDVTGKRTEPSVSGSSEYSGSQGIFLYGKSGEGVQLTTCLYLVKNIWSFTSTHHTS